MNKYLEKLASMSKVAKNEEGDTLGGSMLKGTGTGYWTGAALGGATGAFTAPVAIDRLAKADPYNEAFQNMKKQKGTAKIALGLVGAAGGALAGGLAGTLGGAIGYGVSRDYAAKKRDN